MKQSVLAAAAIAMLVANTTGANAEAAGRFDGVYMGTQRIISYRAMCAAGTDQDHSMLFVEHNHFRKSWGDVLQGDVAPDGSFEASTTPNSFKQAQAGTGHHIKGHITGGDLEADIGNNWCTAHLSLKITIPFVVPVLPTDQCAQMGGQPPGNDPWHVPWCAIARDDCSKIPGYQVVTRPSTVDLSTIVTVCEVPK